MQGQVALAKRTNKQIFSAYSDQISQIVKNLKAIPTHPTIPCPDVLEHVVLADCMVWLRKRKVMCDRNNVGMFNVPGTSGMCRFGIKFGGDIMGCLPNGRHLEVECKRGSGGSLSVGQQVRRKKVLMNNGVYLVVHSVKELNKFMGPMLRR